MDLEILGTPGWREGLLAIIALLVLYIVVLYVRMRRLQRRAEPKPSLAAQSAVAAYAAIQQPDAPAASAEQPAEAGVLAGVSAAAVAADPPPPVTEPARVDFPWNEPPPEVPGKAVIDALQRELYLLRCEVDELRGEVLAAREDLRRQVAQASSSTQGASPLYKEAMHMAIQGHDATAIAHRCGIARAEADLVVALARNRREGFESGTR